MALIDGTYCRENSGEIEEKDLSRIATVYLVQDLFVAFSVKLITRGTLNYHKQSIKKQ